MKRISISVIFIAMIFCINACKTAKQTTTQPQTTDKAVATGAIILKPNQKITVVSNITADSDMGMGMQMKNNSTATNTITVVAADDKNYTLTNTLTKFNMGMDM